MLVSPVVRLGAWLGAKDPRAITWIASIPTALFSTAGVGLTAALALRLGFSRRAAAVSAFFTAFAWMPLAYGASPFPRPISTALLLAAFLLALKPAGTPWRALGAGILAGAAFAVRWSEGVVLVPLCVFTGWKFGFRRAAAVVAGFLLGTLLFVGVTDWLTWGSPMKSLAEYFRIMYVDRPALEEPPPWDYLHDVLKWAGPILILLLWPAWKDRRARPAILVFASIVLLMSVFSHKEWRYLQASIPFLAVGAAAGWERMWNGQRRWRLLAGAAALLTIPYGIERAVSLLSNRSSAEIDASRFISGLSPRPRKLAFVQQWAYGECLYLGNDVEIREIEFSRPIKAEAIGASAAGADVASVYALLLDAEGRRELERLGFRQIARFRRLRAYECLVFGRGAYAAAAASSASR